MADTYHLNHAVMCPAPDTGAVHHMPSKPDNGLAFASAVPAVPPPHAPQRSKEEEVEVFRRLRGLKRRFGSKPNKTELTIALITACILEGWNTRPRIIGVFHALDQNYKHAALVLRKATGSDPKRHHWDMDADGHYRVHLDTEVVADA